MCVQYGPALPKGSDILTGSLLLAGFLTPFWGTTFVLAAVTAGFYKFAPAPGDELYITRYIGQFKTPSEAWARLNEQHLIGITDESEGQLLQASATRPPTHRYRYPQ